MSRIKLNPAFGLRHESKCYRRENCEDSKNYRWQPTHMFLFFALNFQLGIKYYFTCKERIYGARTPPRPPPSDPIPSPIVRTDVGNNSAVYVYTTENDA